MNGCKNDPEKLSMAKIDKIISSGFSMSSIIQRHRK